MTRKLPYSSPIDDVTVSKQPVLFAQPTCSALQQDVEPKEVQYNMYEAIQTVVNIETQEATRTRFLAYILRCRIVPQKHVY